MLSTVLLRPNAVIAQSGGQIFGLLPPIRSVLAAEITF